VSIFNPKEKPGSPVLGDPQVPLSLQGVSKSFGPVHALNQVSITIRPNEVVGIIGENGAGKSTLLKILSGIYQPDSGQVLLGGAATTLRTPAEAAKQGIAVVHQEQSLLTNLSVAENILLGAQAVRGGKGRAGVNFGLYNWNRINEQATDALSRIGGHIDPRAKVSTLSFADRQMVEIAKAVDASKGSSRPPVIILDEPTSVLESDDIEQLEQEIARLKALGSLIFVSHRLDEVLRICDRIYVMRAGEVVAERDTATVNDSELFALMTGREHVEHRQESYRTETPVLEVADLNSKHYRDVTLTVNRGEVHTLIGVKDSGREELCRAIFGIIPRRGKGSVRVDGKPLTGRSTAQAARAGVAYLPAERKTESMIAGMTLSENLTLTHPGKSAVGPFLRLRKQTAVTREWIDQLEVRPPDPRADIARLSGGNQQKIVLAKWLTDPKLKLLLLDHPTRGVDPGAREKVYEAMNAARARGVGVLLLADTLEEAIAVSDKITVMRDGEISATYDVREGVPTMAELIARMV
jgi:ribose transport system ATP-binding protein